MANTFINTNDIRDAAVTAAKLGVPTTTPTANKFAGWDANLNLSANSHIEGYATTVTANSTITLTVTSAKNQFFTGTQNHTMVLPVTSTLVLGQQFVVVNRSSSSVTVSSSNGSGFSSVFAGWMSVFTCILTSGVTSASWDVRSIPLLTNAQNGFVPYSGATTNVNIGTNTFQSGNITLSSNTAGLSTFRIRNSSDINNWVDLVMSDNGSTAPYEYLTFRFKQMAFGGGPTIDTLVLDGSGFSLFNNAGIRLQDTVAAVIGIKTPDTIVTPYTLYLPDNPGTFDGDVLTTDASGITRWADLSATYLKLDGTNGPLTGALTLASGGLITTGTTSGAVTIKSVTGTWTMSLPTSGGTSNYFLQTNGSGVTTWAAAVGGSGTTGNLMKWSSSTAATNSILTESGSTVTLTNSTVAANTVANGHELINSQVAPSSGNQMYSPALYFKAQGWKTQSTAGSQVIEQRMYVKPVQAFASPGQYFSHEVKTNGGSWTEIYSYNSTLANAKHIFTGAIQADYFMATSTAGGGFFHNVATNNYLQMFVANNGGVLSLGVEGSAGATFFDGTATAFASVIGTSSAVPIMFYTNGTLKYTLASSGANTWTGSGAFGGAITATGNVTLTKSNAQLILVAPSAGINNILIKHGGTDKWSMGQGYTGNSDDDFFIYNYYTGSSSIKLSSVNNSVVMAGDVYVIGALSKGSGSFKIDHPLESKKEYDLVHSFIEGPKADLIYRGKIQLVNGTAIVDIDDVSGMTQGTFEALCQDVQCFTTNEDTWDNVKGSVQGNILTIHSQNPESIATISWIVIGERKDKHMLETNWTDENGHVIVEPLKQ